MTKKKAKADDEGGIVLSGCGILTINIKLELHQDESLFGVPTILEHRVQTVIPDPAVGRGHKPERFMSAGQIFGQELGRIAHHFREGLADHKEMAAGFAREMQEWEMDYGKGVSDG